MDSHFSNVLGQASASQVPQITFIPASSFEGRKHGYKFQKGSKGLGYYYDRFQSKTAVASMAPEPEPEQEVDDRKRKRDDEEDMKDKKGKPSIEELLENAEDNGITQLDSFSLKQLLLNFEKKITKNQKMRMKYPDEPEKFLESEMELHAEIQELHAVAASPELYPILVQTNAVASILGCLSHENTDISLAVIGLLQEMTEPDTLEDNLTEAAQLLEALKTAQGYELLVQNLSRLNEASGEEDATGVQQTLAVIENVTDLDATQGVYICEKTHILKYLLERSGQKDFDANKLSASELLSILLQLDSKIPELLYRLSDIDGMDTLLQAIAVYRKKEVIRADEQECVENLFLSLGAALGLRANQQRFLDCEGFELLMRCLKEQQYAAGCAVAALNYAILRNKACCARLVDVGGMKYVFPLLTGGGLKKALKRKGSGERRNWEESALSIVAQLCTWLGTAAEGTEPSKEEEAQAYPVRLLHKLTEKDHEKLERCVELYGKYSRQVDSTDEDIERTREDLRARLAQLQQQQGDEDSEDDEAEELIEEARAALAELDDEDYLYGRRLEGGMFNQQQAACVIAYAAIFDPASYHIAQRRLATEQATMEDVLTTLRDMLLTLQQGQEEHEQDDAKAAASEEAEMVVDRQYKQVVVQWCAALSKLVYAESN